MPMRTIAEHQPATMKCSVCDAEAPQEITNSVIRDKPKSWVVVSADVLPRINMLICKNCFKLMFAPFLKKTA